MKTVLVKDLGPQLPIGFQVERSKKLVKTFSLRKYNAWVDRAMNAYREGHVGSHVMYLVAKLLSLIVSEAGGHSFGLENNKDSSPEQLNRICEMNFADVLYMYLYARIQVAPDMRISYGCPNPKCKVVTAEVNVDLRNVEVVCAENASECKFWVDLKDGIKLNNGQRCKRLQLKTIPFRTILLEGATQGGIDEGLAYSQLREAVCSVEGAGDNYVLTDDELDQMGKIDSLILDRTTGKLAAGPKMRTTINCDKCQQPIERALDWRFDHFFDSSIPAYHLMI